MFSLSRVMARTKPDAVSAASKPISNAVHGVTYIGVLKSSPEYGAKPLVAGIVTLRGQNCLSWDQFKKTATLVGKDYFFKTAVQSNESMTLEGVFAILDEVVSTVRSRYEDKHKTPLEKGLPVILPGGVLTAPEFVNHCICLQELPPNSLVACKGPKPISAEPSPPASAVGDEQLNSAKPSSPTSAGHEEQLNSAKLSAPTSVGGDGQLPSARTFDSSSSGLQGGGSHHDTTDALSMAMQEGGLVDFVSPAQVIVQDGGELSLGAQVEIEGGVYEDDRLVEDMLELIDQHMSPGDKEHMVVKRFTPTIKRLQKSLKEEKEKSRKLSELSLLQDTKIKSMQKQAAESLAPGINSSVKEAFGPVQGDLKKILDEGFQKMGTLVKEEGRSGSQAHLDDLKLSIAGLVTKIEDISQLTRNAMGASFKIDWNLSSVGLGVRSEAARSVDIPFILQEILSTLQQSHPPPVRPPVDSFSSPANSLGFSTPSAPPRRSRIDRWDRPHSTPDAAAKSVSKPAGRSLGADFDSPSGRRPVSSVGSASASPRPGAGSIASDMERASGWPGLNHVTQMTSDEIDKRIEQLSSSKKPRLN